MALKKTALIDPKIQAKWFSRVRDAHQMETTEDYVELIADLIHANKEARLSDLAERFGVSHPTANKVVARLQKEGYVISQPYRSIFLTPKGEELAKKCKERHQIVLDFLIRLGVPEDIAEADAEGIEHHISQKTLHIFQEALKK